MIVCARCNTRKTEAGDVCPQCGSHGDATSAAFGVAAPSASESVVSVEVGAEQ